MTEPQSLLQRHGWILALAIALAFLIVDSGARMRSSASLTSTQVGTSHPLVPDSSTASGYEGNQHDVVVPVLGIDGYHWMMQTQLMVARSDARVRHVDYDGPKEGRDVHWSSLPRWWATPFAAATSRIKDVPLSRAVEIVFPWVNTVFLALLLIAVVPLTNRRFGPLAASLIALGSVAIYPVYSVYSVGYFDHHGFAASCALLMVLFIVGGGAGWVRREAVGSGPSEPPDNSQQIGRLLTAAQARKWFVASGVAAGAGLAISAATAVPAMLGMGLAALFCALTFARSSDSTAPWQVDAGLWRTWGLAAAATSLLLYLIEYFPSHLGMRLEVNHPLYALACFAGGDLLSRIHGNTWRGADSRGAAMLALLDVTILALLPATVLLFPETFALRPGSFVMNVHEDYIGEFRSLGWQLAHWSWAQINAGIGLLPLLALGPAVAIGFARGIATPLRASVLLSLGPAIVFTVLAMRHVRWLSIGVTLWLGTLVVVAAVATVAVRTWRWRSTRAVLTGVGLGALGAVAPVVFLHGEAAAAKAAAVGSDGYDWMAVLALALEPAKEMLAVLVTLLVIGAAVFATLGVARRWTRTRMVFGGVLLGLIFLPFPALAAYRWAFFKWMYPPTTSDLTQIVARDIARKLRTRLGPDRGVVAAAPTTTTWLMYFGGMKGIGTFYWENASGLMTAASMFGAVPANGATAAANARLIAEAQGVTHVVVFSWDSFADEYTRLLQGRRAPASPGSDRPALMAAFAPLMVHERKIPPWLRPVPYQLPPIAGMDRPWAWIFEVVHDQSPAEAAARYAQYSIAMNDIGGALNQINAALAAQAEYLPALISLARIQQANPQLGDFQAAVRRVRASAAGADSIALEDNISLASMYWVAADTIRARETMLTAIAQADARTMRRLPPDFTLLNFVTLARQLGLAAVRPEVTNFAIALLPPSVREQLRR